MFSIFTLAFFLLIIGLLFVLLGIIFNKDRFSAFYKIALGLIVVFVIICVDWGPSNEERKLFSGQYVVDTVGSKFSRQLVSKYSDLTLTVKKDLNFEINRPSPFFTSTKGTWDYDNRADYEILSYKFEDSAVEHQIFPPDAAKWELATGDSSGRTITFKRITK